MNSEMHWEQIQELFAGPEARASVPMVFAYVPAFSGEELGFLQAYAEGRELRVNDTIAHRAVGDGILGYIDDVSRAPNEAHCRPIGMWAGCGLMLYDRFDAVGEEVGVPALAVSLLWASAHLGNKQAHATIVAAARSITLGRRTPGGVTDVRPCIDDAIETTEAFLECDWSRCETAALATIRSLWQVSWPQYAATRMIGDLGMTAASRA